MSIQRRSILRGGAALAAGSAAAGLALPAWAQARTKVNVGYLQERTRAAEGLEYVSRVVDASIAWRF